MKRTAARIASALLAFILGIITNSLWRQHSTPQSSLPQIPISKSTLNEPATAGMAVAIPVTTPNPDPAFGGGLKLVSNEVQLKNQFLRYKINLTYPQIDGSDALPIQKLNKHIERLVTNNYQWLLTPSREDLRYYKHGLHPEAFNSVALYYEVILATDSFLSIYFEGFSYGIGAAHSVQHSFVVNYDLKSNRQLKLSDIFKPGSKYMEFISEFSKEELSQTAYGESLFRDELAPLAANFESWNMTHDGIRFNFDACKVFGCASGKQTVLVPFTALRPMMSIR